MEANSDKFDEVIKMVKSLNKTKNKKKYLNSEFDLLHSDKLIVNKSNLSGFSDQEKKNRDSLFLEFGKEKYLVYSRETRITSELNYDLNLINTLEKSMSNYKNSEDKQINNKINNQSNIINQSNKQNLETNIVDNIDVDINSNTDNDSFNIVQPMRSVRIIQTKQSEKSIKSIKSCNKIINDVIDDSLNLTLTKQNKNSFNNKSNNIEDFIRVSINNSINSSKSDLNCDSDNEKPRNSTLLK